ncbi:Phytochelatin synthase-domain-containing protein [Fimicolochytrium jonesii]|uniref:Phytochelatin synthase-domain-containing protein n=1 Tax=Fimicolochytrium jonesii TaxID=1396493 RepID=UPI0022FE7FC7|nr:Phytochelatin synthase-domain-containing protein [Fimicolochytrium jonesii]KAI8825881.1 Phytochelatin synthase-domain-containing protein [Fimicolochytrium jonesii]
MSTTSSIATLSHVERQQKIPEKTFYKRVLPSTCTPFNSSKGRALFSEALTEGYMETYFSLSLQFLTQAEPAFCGLSTLCMILNTLEMDPGRQWRGSVWRWYDESMLDCCRPLEHVLKSGITLPEFVCLARCNGLKATMSRADKATKEAFLMALKQTSREPSEFMVVSYDRGTLQQTGSGHFSPVGGYNEKENMVLILDVARFKYPAYWVSFDLLWESLQPKDSATNKPRGYITLTKGKRSYVQSALSQLAVNRESWPRLSRILFSELPRRFAASPPNSPADFINVVLESIPDVYDSVVENRMPLFVTPSPIPVSDGDGCSKDDDDEEDPVAAFEKYMAGLDELLLSLAQTELYKLVESSMATQRKAKRRIENANLAAEKLSDLVNGRVTALTDELGGENSAPPSSPRYHSSRRGSVVQSQLLLSFRPTPLSSPAISAVDLLPQNHPVKDFTAFLTMFLFALFSYKPFHEDLPDVLDESIDSLPTAPIQTAAPAPAIPARPYRRRESMAVRVREVVNLDVAGVQDPTLRKEVAFLRSQIAALTELVDSDTQPTNGVLTKVPEAPDVPNSNGTAGAQAIPPSPGSVVDVSPPVSV